MCEKKDFIHRTVFAFLLFVITYIVVFKEVLMGGDYIFHTASANRIYLNTIGNYFFHENPYFMWHFLVKSANQIFYMPMEYAAATVSAWVNTIVYLLSEKVMRRYRVFHSSLIAFLLCLVGPIYIPWYNPNLYLGQGTPNTWHNPTNLMAKPFAVCCFFMVYYLLIAIQNRETIKRSQYMILSVLIFLSTLAKPSFVQGFIPGLGVYLIILCVKDRFQNFFSYLCLCLTFVPSVCLMVYQFMVSFYTGNVTEGVGIGWLEVISQYSPNVWFSLLLLFCFPCFYLLLNFKRMYKERDIQFSLCYEAAAWLEYAFLYEKGSRKYDGNFGWASLLSAFLLWMVVLIHFANDMREMQMSDGMQRVKNGILLVILLLHILCGCYYVFCLITIGGVWL